MNYVAVIPARAGSKRIKNKNLFKINGKYLFDYTLNAAKKCKKISKVIVSTNIKKIIKKNTSRVLYLLRPDYLCKDNSSTESAIMHILNNMKIFFYKKDVNIILLQPTSPLRTDYDISKAINIFEKNNYDSLFSGYEENFFLWEKKNKKIIPYNYLLNKRIRSQNKKSYYVENGAIFIFRANLFKVYKNRLFRKIGISLMSKRKSLEIDTHEDIKLLKTYI
jgi:CMP-N-acetylneuraminic acid synthetase